MSKIDYIQASQETPEDRNEEFYAQIKHNWQKRAKDLRNRRWEKIEKQH